MSIVKKSHLFYSHKLPSARRWGPGAILIYDKVLNSKPEIKKWIESVPHSYGVKSGEKLKSLDQFPRHMKRILDLSAGLPTKEITILTLGGGSVGDFGGFVASVLKRGVRLVHIPSTWLAAVDSSHGGKTGLNIAKVKNQIGSFYPADEIHMVKSLLETQPQIRVFEALGEVLKMSLIEGRHLWHELQDLQQVTSQIYWKYLPQIVHAKYRVVEKDPFEIKGLRHVLNLGHTLGHVWESKLKIPHGIAVLYGVSFALEWSLFRKTLSSRSYYQIRLSEFGSFLPDRLDLKKILRQTKNPKKLLLQDKKISKGKKIRFVFLASPGRPVIEAVSFESLTEEMERQAL